MSNRKLCLFVENRYDSVVFKRLHGVINNQNIVVFKQDINIVYVRNILFLICFSAINDVINICVVKSLIVKYFHTIINNFCCCQNKVVVVIMNLQIFIIKEFFGLLQVVGVYHNKTLCETEHAN